jgi:ABC-2 type transport system permease protein
MKRDLTILGVFVQDSMAYRSQVTLWMLTDIVPSIIMPFVWIAGLNGRTNIRGFGPAQLVMYYLTMTFISNFIVAHVQWEMARDIKEGILSKFLLYPFSYLRYQYLGNVAYRLMRCVLFLPFAVIWFVIFHRYMGVAALGDLHVGYEFWLTLGLGHLVAFWFAAALGTLGFFFIETQALYFGYYILLAVFSGQLAPYGLLPPGLRMVAEWTPFRYTLSFPLEVLNGRVHGDAFWTGVLFQAAWLALLWTLAQVGWRAGTKRYAGTGM